MSRSQLPPDSTYVTIRQHPCSMHTPWSTCMSPPRWCEDGDACDCFSHQTHVIAPRITLLLACTREVTSWLTSLPLLPSRASQRQRGETERRDRETEREQRESRERERERESCIYRTWCMARAYQGDSLLSTTPYPTLNHTACLEARSLSDTTRATHHVPIYHKMNMPCMECVLGCVGLCRDRVRRGRPARG